MSSYRRIAALALIPILTLDFLVSCGPESSSKVERATSVMGTVFTATVYGLKQEEADAAIDEAFEEMQRLNSLMSNWDRDSGISRLNQAAAEDWAIADPEIFALVLSALRYSRLSSGAFDVTAGPLVRLWGFLRRSEQRPPSPSELKAAMARVGYEKIEVDEERGAIRFSAEGMEIDLGGIAKGYAVDQAAALMRKRGVASALVNLGGNIISIGSPPGRQAWRVAVRDPRSSEGTIGYLEIAGAGVASSGQYERYFEYRGKRYGHIIDPRSGRPVEGVLGTTIVAPDGQIADILSTAVFVLGPDKGPALISSQEGVEGMIILPRSDGGVVIKISKRLRPRFRLGKSVTDADIVEF